MSFGKKVSLRHSLAFRLTLWYAGIFTLSSCIAFLLFYTFITTLLRVQTDQDLQSHVNRFSTLLRVEDIEEVKAAALIEAQAAGVKKVFFRFLSINGQVFSSSNMAFWKNIAIQRAAIEQLLAGQATVFESLVIPERREKVRILYAQVSPGIILQVGQSMENHSRFLDAFRGMFVSTMTLLIVLATGFGWFMARRAVSGVEAVTLTARRISGGTLEERVPVKTGGDEIDQLALTFNQMLDRIQQLLGEIKEMSDNIAHDLRSPVTRIRGLAEVTLTTGKSLSEYQTMAASTIEECDRLLSMINTMLMISKAEAGIEKLSLESIDLTGIVKEACDLFEAMAEDKGIELICTAPENHRITADRGMIQRMLSNLLDNAIKYTPAGGRVRVSLSERGSHEAMISVQDTGVGIAENDLLRIFDRFYRCDASRSQAGIGLGLSLARAVARAHGGDITVTSTLRQGSTFTATLRDPDAATPVHP
jgi:heavy metal sensor kinase